MKMYQTGKYINLYTNLQGDSLLILSRVLVKVFLAMIYCDTTVTLKAGILKYSISIYKY